MLIRFQQHGNSGMPVWVNPRYVRSVRALGEKLAEIVLPKNQTFAVVGKPEDIAVDIARHQDA